MVVPCSDLRKVESVVQKVDEQSPSMHFPDGSDKEVVP